MAALVAIALCSLDAAETLATKPRHKKNRPADVPQVPEATERATTVDEALAAVGEAIADTRDNKAKAEDPKSTPQEKAEAQAAIARSAATVEAKLSAFPDSPKLQEAGARHAAVSGNLPLALGRAARAVEAARDRQDGGSLAGALATRAWIEHGAGDWKNANRDAAEALRLDPANDVAREVFHYTENAKTVPNAVVPVGRWPLERWRMEQILSDTPLPEQTRDAEPRVGAAETEDWGKRAVARQEAIKILEHNFALLANNDPRAALRALDRAQSLAPGLPDVYMQRALAWQHLNNPAAAVTEFGRAIGLWEARPKIDGDAKGSVAAAYSLRALSKREIQDARGALADAERSITLNPAGGGGYFERGLAREALGEPPAAFLEDMKRAAQLDARYAERYRDTLARYAKQDGAAQAAERGNAPGEQAGSARGGRESGDARGGANGWGEWEEWRRWLAPFGAGAGLVGAVALFARRKSGRT